MHCQMRLTRDLMRGRLQEFPLVGGVQSGHVSMNAGVSRRWEEKWDAAQGKAYYVNHQTKSTAWSSPYIQENAPA